MVRQVSLRKDARLNAALGTGKYVAPIRAQRARRFRDRERGHEVATRPATGQQHRLHLARAGRPRARPIEMITPAEKR